jgi:hypothetical protein
MFTKTLTQDGHVRQYLISDVGHEGWEVREERDARVVRQAFYTDWHRVERALAAFSNEVATLEERGWLTSE